MSSFSSVFAQIHICVNLFLSDVLDASLNHVSFLFSLPPSLPNLTVALHVNNCSPLTVTDDVCTLAYVHFMNTLTMYLIKSICKGKKQKQIFVIYSNMFHSSVHETRLCVPYFGLYVNLRSCHR